MHKVLEVELVRWNGQLNLPEAKRHNFYGRWPNLGKW